MGHAIRSVEFDTLCKLKHGSMPPTDLKYAKKALAHLYILCLLVLLHLLGSQAVEISFMKDHLESSPLFYCWKRVCAAD